MKNDDMYSSGSETEGLLDNDGNPLANAISDSELRKKNFFFSRISKYAQDLCCPWFQRTTPKDFVLIYLMLMLSVLGSVLSAIGTFNYIEPIFDNTREKKSAEDTHLASTILVMSTAFSTALLNALMHWNLHMKKAPFSKRLLIGNAVANIEFAAGLLAAVGSFYFYQQYKHISDDDDKSRLQHIENIFLFSSFLTTHGAVLTCIDFSVTYVGSAALSIFSRRKNVIPMNEYPEERSSQTKYGTL